VSEWAQRASNKQRADRGVHGRAAGMLNSAVGDALCPGLILAGGWVVEQERPGLSRMTIAAVMRAAAAAPDELARSLAEVARGARVSRRSRHLNI